MIRFQIYLEESQEQQLSRIAKRLRVPKSRLVREGIDLILQKNAYCTEDPLLSLIGQAGSIGRSDVSEMHDLFIAESNITKEDAK